MGVTFVTWLPPALREPAGELWQHPFLQQLAREDAEALLGLVQRRTVKPGTEIIRAGSAGHEVVLVLQGRVRLVAYGAERREVVLALRGPGELIGEMAALGAGRRTATAVTVDDARWVCCPLPSSWSSCASTPMPRSC